MLKTFEFTLKQTFKNDSAAEGWRSYRKYLSFNRELCLRKTEKKKKFVRYDFRYCIELDGLEFGIEKWYFYEVKKKNRQ